MITQNLTVLPRPQLAAEVANIILASRPEIASAKEKGLVLNLENKKGGAHEDATQQNETKRQNLISLRCRGQAEPQLNRFCFSLAKCFRDLRKGRR